MNDKIIQIIPAPANMCYAFEDGKTYPVACLALVELSNGDREVHAMLFSTVAPSRMCAVRVQSC